MSYRPIPYPRNEEDGRSNIVKVMLQMRYIVFRCVTLCSDALHCVQRRYIVFRCLTLFSDALHCAQMRYVALHYVTMCYYFFIMYKYYIFNL